MPKKLKRDYKAVYKHLDETRPVTGFDVSFRLEDAEELSRGLDLLPPNPVGLTIGSHLGASDYFMCTYRPDLTMYSLDCSPTPKWLFNLQGLKAIQLTGMSDTYEWDKPIDLLFVDGDHSCQWCRHDLTRFIPFVKDNGIIAGHDYDIETVSLVVDKLLLPYKKLAASHSYVYQKCSP